MDPVTWVYLIVMVVLMVASYLLMPRPKAPTPPQAKDLDAPTADASRPVPVVFGSLTVKSPNCLWYGNVASHSYKVSA